MTKVRYIADSLAEALAAARRQHGAGMRVVQSGARRTGLLSARAFEVVVEAPFATGLGEGLARSRRAARLALARATIAARTAADEAMDAVEAATHAAIARRSEGAAAQVSPAVQPAVVARLAARLRMQALPEELVAQVVARVEAELAADPRAPGQAGVARAAALQAIATLLPVAAPSQPLGARAEGRPHVVAIAGATGVGKTTTVAKLAAGYRADQGLRVGLIAADAFRVGAVDQLRVYASIIGASLRTADSASSVREALASLAACDVVLVDTPGRGHRDAERIADLCALIDAARPDETHLVLAGSASAGSLVQCTDAFAQVGATSIVLSKLDECEGLGALLAAVRRGGRAARWFTTGQEVPDDLEVADARAFAMRLLGDEDEGSED